MISWKSWSPSPSSSLRQGRRKKHRTKSAEWKPTPPLLSIGLVVGFMTTAVLGSPVGIGSRSARSRRSASNSDSGRKTSLNFPIANLAESLAASAARSTIVALSSSSSLFCGGGIDEEEEEFVLLLCRSPRNTNKNSNRNRIIRANTLTDKKDDKEGEERSQENATWENFLESLHRKSKRQNGERNATKGSELEEEEEEEVSRLLHSNAATTTTTTTSTAPIWILQDDNGSDKHPPLVAAFTGFGPDIRHLVRRVARSLWDTAIGSTYSRRIPVKTVVQDYLAPPLVKAAGGSGRPFGVQSLVVGSSPTTSPSLLVYTMDPSGGWRHWGSGITAIGHQAAMVRHFLRRHSLVQKDKKQQQNEEEQEAASDKGRDKDTQKVVRIQVALEQAMKAFVDTFASKEKKSNDDEEEYYTAMVVFCQPQASSLDDDGDRHACCWTLDRAAIAKAYQECHNNPRRK